MDVQKLNIEHAIKSTETTTSKRKTEKVPTNTDIVELDAAVLNKLVKEIVVHEEIDSDKIKHISIEIHFNLKPIPEVEQVRN